MATNLNQDQSASASASRPEAILPNIPSLALSRSRAYVLESDGEIQEISLQQAGRKFHKKAAITCHGPYTSRRLDLRQWTAFDLLELFAFTYPGRFCVPTPLGILKATGWITHDKGINGEDIALGLYESAEMIMRDLLAQPAEKILPVAEVMGLNGRGWPWTPYIFKSFGHSYDPKKPLIAKSALNIWKSLPEWSDGPPIPPSGEQPVEIKEAVERLNQLISTKGSNLKPRAEQEDYARKITKAFQPIYEEQDPHAVLAEAGTGVGKTLGYLAPASVWAEKNEGCVWVSTYTKSLQRQIQNELDTLYPEKDLNHAHIAMRKGRENYLCLLNLEDKAGSAAVARNPTQAIALGIMTRWAAVSEDGDLTGRDFPSWLTSLLGYQYTTGLADKRGECIYSACDHYHRCFVEKSIRKARYARVVVANHAVVMVQAAMAADSDDLPTRYIFDEGHHLFSAADSAFSAHLTGREGYDLKRWLAGAMASRQSNSRARGLRKRIEDLVSGDENAQALLDEILATSRILPDENWAARLKDEEPHGVFESLIFGIYRQVQARAKDQGGLYSIECETFPVSDKMLIVSEKLKVALSRLADPMLKLAALLEKRLHEDEGELTSDTRKRLDSVSQMLKRKARTVVIPWVDMLKTFESEKTPEEYVDWMEIERVEGRVVDVGLYRHFKDPMKAFAQALRPHVSGIAVTSATLRDQQICKDQESKKNDNSWTSSLRQSGLSYLSKNPVVFEEKSPFDYVAQTKVFVIQDVIKTDLGQVSGAFKSLFKASGGGAMGIFTSIQRLRMVHEVIQPELERDHMTLYAQHVDPLDPGTLVDIFREDKKSCLLGTDAMRDGVDVPGESLRLVVFDKVPWPRPTILHKARRNEFDGRRYDDSITRLKLKQAYGRLIRRESDKGVFVILDKMMPSRLYSAFPDNVDVQKISLSQARHEIENFIGLDSDIKA